MFINTISSLTKFATPKKNRKIDYLTSGIGLNIFWNNIISCHLSFLQTFEGTFYVNLCFEQKYEKYQRFFLSENFQFLEVKFSVYLNGRVFVMRRHLWSLATHRVPFEDSDQTAWMRRLIWVFAGRTCNLVGNAVSCLICELKQGIRNSNITSAKVKERRGVRG